MLARVDPPRRQTIGADVRKERRAERRRHELAEREHVRLPFDVRVGPARIGDEPVERVQPVIERVARRAFEAAEHRFVTRDDRIARRVRALVVAARFGDRLQLIGDARQRRHDDEHAPPARAMRGGDAADVLQRGRVETLVPPNLTTTHGAVGGSSASSRAITLPIATKLASRSSPRTSGA